MLEAAVFVRRLRSPQELVMPVIDDLVRELQAEPAVAQALSIRPRAEDDTADVVPIRKPRAEGSPTSET